MKKQNNTFNDAIFIVTEEHSCPIYNVGEEFKVEHYSITGPTFKPACLYLIRRIMDITTSRTGYTGHTQFDSQKSRFDCGGCEGLIHFELKKDRDFATPQMKLLNETEERQKRQHLDRFFDPLRNLVLFEPLDDDALSDLTILLEVKTIPAGKVLIRSGDPGSSLYILLQGRVAVIAEDGSRVAEMGTGHIFGEMSLLTGEPATSSIHTVATTQVAMLSHKNFKHVLKKYPALKLFLFKLLVNRAQAQALRSGIITSGMSGNLAHISTADLFWRIHSTRKTGTVQLILDQGKAAVFFKDGQIIHARFLNMRNKEAVLFLLEIPSGHFTYSKGIPADLEKLPAIGDFTEIMHERRKR